jgi:hypothetical protein
MIFIAVHFATANNGSTAPLDAWRVQPSEEVMTSRAMRMMFNESTGCVLHTQGMLCPSAPRHTPLINLINRSISKLKSSLTPRASLHNLVTRHMARPGRVG